MVKQSAASSSGKIDRLQASSVETLHFKLSLTTDERVANQYEGISSTLKCNLAAAGFQHSRDPREARAIF
jgi:hypothetical protein